MVFGTPVGRGAAEEYDAWEKLGNPGWGWKALLPYFKKGVTCTPLEEKLQQESVASNDDAGLSSGSNYPVKASNADHQWPGLSTFLLGCSIQRPC